jgi:hypothetical protein
MNATVGHEMQQHPETRKGSPENKQKTKPRKTNKQKQSQERQRKGR